MENCCARRWRSMEINCFKLFLYKFLIMSDELAVNIGMQIFLQKSIKKLAQAYFARTCMPSVMPCLLNIFLQSYCDLFLIISHDSICPVSNSDIFCPRACLRGLVQTAKIDDMRLIKHSYHLIRKKSSVLHVGYQKIPLFIQRQALFKPKKVIR